MSVFSKFKFLTSALILCGSFPLMFSCSGSNESGKSNTPSMSANEKEVYNCIIGSIAYFKDPSSVRLIRVSEQQFIGRYVTISAKNSFGGKVQEDYLAYNSALHSIEKSVSYRVDYTIDVSAINSNIAKYIENMGW